MKRRRRNRRLAVVVSLLVVAALIGVVAYTASLSGRGSVLDAMVTQPVASTDMTALLAASIQPYGPAPTTAMAATIHQPGGSPWSTARPEVLYIGGEFCMYCALQRWALVVALSRFGNFSRLHYMTSGANEGDLATFTFVGSSYSSDYVMFRPYELEDRSNPPQALQTLPSNYTAVWNQYGHGFPFLDFGGTYVIAGSLLADTSVLQGRNWTAIIGSIAASDSGGSQIRQAANLITALVCKLTQGSPSSVCGASPIDAAPAGIAGPIGDALAATDAPEGQPALSRGTVIQRSAKGP